MNKLLEAVRSGDLVEVARFINEKNNQTKFDNSALIEAFRGGRDDIAELLINAKIYYQPTRTHSHSFKLVNPPEFSGLLGHLNDFSLDSDFEPLEPPLEGSKQWCNDEIMLNMDDKSVSSFDRIRRLPSPLLLATYYGRDKIVQKLIDEKMNLEETDYDGNTALILAIYSSNPGIVTMLLEAEAKVNHVNHYKGTALIAAAYIGDAIIAAKLIEHGALLNHEHQHDKVGTALMLAAQRGNTGVVEVLLTAKALVNQVSSNGNTALHSAAQGGSLSSLHRLLLAGADVGAVNASGAFPLSLAAAGGHVSLVDAFLDAVAQSNHINSAVVAAARYGRLNVMQKLLDAGAKDAGAKDAGAKDAGAKDAGANKETYLAQALIEAAKIGNVALINLLFNKKEIDIDYFNNTSALIVAAERGHSEVVQKLIQEGAGLLRIDVAMVAAVKRNSPDIVRILIEAGANLQSINSALVHAAQRGHLDCVNLLIKAGADLSSVNRALIGAAQNNYPQVVSALLGSGADKEIDLALIEAAKRGAMSAMTVLLDKGNANVNYVASDGNTALTLAIKGNHGVIMQYLINRVDAAHLNVALNVAIEQGRFAVVEVLLNAGADMSGLINHKDAKTVFLAAAKEGFDGLVKMFINANKIDESQLNKALIEVGYSAQINVLQLLINAGANINSADANGDTALINAMQARLYSYFNTEKRDMAIMALLSYEPDLSCANKKGDTAIKLAKNILESKRNSLSSNIAEKLTEISVVKIEQVNTKQKVSGSLATLFFKENTDTEASKVERQRQFNL